MKIYNAAIRRVNPIRERSPGVKHPQEMAGGPLKTGLLLNTDSRE